MAASSTHGRGNLFSFRDPINSGPFSSLTIVSKKKFTSHDTALIHFVTLPPSMEMDATQIVGKSCLP